MATQSNSELQEKPSLIKSLTYVRSKRGMGQNSREIFWNYIYDYALYKWREASTDPGVKRQKAKLSRHALIRYIERVKNIDVNALEAEIMTEAAFKKISEIGGNGKFVLNDLTYVVEYGKVVTVYPHIPGKPRQAHIKPDGTKVYSYE